MQESASLFLVRLPGGGLETALCRNAATPQDLRREDVVVHHLTCLCDTSLGCLFARAADINGVWLSVVGRGMARKSLCCMRCSCALCPLRVQRMTHNKDRRPAVYN